MRLESSASFVAEHQRLTRRDREASAPGEAVRRCFGERVVRASKTRLLHFKPTPRILHWKPNLQLYTQPQAPKALLSGTYTPNPTLETQL